MSLEFKCLDYKKEELVTLEGVAKATEVTGVGTPGVFMYVPNGAVIPTGEFCELVKYFLTNYELRRDDPRIELVEFVNKLAVVEGWSGKGSRRLEYHEKKP